MKLDFKNNLTLRTKMALTEKVLKAKFDCTFEPQQNFWTFKKASSKSLEIPT